MRKTGYLLWLALFLATLAALVYQWPKLADPNTFEEDVRNLYWINKLEDMGLYPNDQLIAYKLREGTFLGKPYLIEIYDPGYSLLFTAGSWFMPPLLLSKLLVFPLMLISVSCLYKIGQRWGTENEAFVLCLAFAYFNLVSSTNISVVGGLQRSFTYPLLLGTVYALLRNRHILASALVFLSSTIYPPVFVITAALTGLAGVEWRGFTRLPRLCVARLIPLGIATLLGLVVLWPAIPKTAASQASGEVSVVSTLLASGFGRFPLFTIPPFIGSHGLFQSPMDGLQTLFLLILAILISLILRGEARRKFRMLPQLLVASFGLFTLAWLGWLVTGGPILYLPSRYTQNILPLALLAFCVWNLPEAFSRGIERVRSHKRSVSLGIGGVLLGVVGLVLATGSGMKGEVKVVLAGLACLVTALLVIYQRQVPTRSGKILYSPARTPAILRYLAPALILPVAWFYLWLVPDGYITPPEEEQRLIQFIASQPVDVLVGGSPCSLNNLPLLAKRKVLFSCETPSADGNLMLAGLQAYYASGPAAIRQFCSDYQVDLLVVNREDFTPEKIAEGRYFFEPYNSLLTPTVSKQSDFALLHVEREDMLYEDGKYQVVRCW